MEEIEVVLERHEQKIKTLERDMTDIKTVQAELRPMHIETHFLACTYSPLHTKDDTRTV